MPEDKMTIEKETTVAVEPGNNKSQENAATDTATASESQKPVGQKPDEAPDQNDITEVISLLNEIQTMNGGPGDINEIPDGILGPIKYLVQKMIVIRDAFDDPLFKDILDDMSDQQESGEVPSVLVAVARNVPIEEIQNLADSEDYAGVQKAVSNRIQGEKANAENMDKLYAKFDATKQNIETYCSEMGYDEAEKEALYAAIALLRDAFADGELTVAELKSIDEMRNYKRDTDALKSQIPEVPEKVQIPDNASLQSAQQPVPAKPAPKLNNLEALGASGAGATDFTQVGKRKFMK